MAALCAVTLVLGPYFGALALLSLASLHRAHLAWAARHGGGGLAPPTGRPDAALPEVLVQLPLYDEPFVAERALRAVAALDWPRDRLVLQVLDDSTDATVDVVARVAHALAASGVRVEHVRRGARVGWKAGALAEGLARSGAPFVAVFDADFMPRPDFLRRAIAPLLDDPGLALVQARWHHANRDASALTRAQALFLDAHFALEHGGRAALGLPFNFNGTAGVWRRAAIDAVGGWSADTLTEDLDLSYRAQLAGWRFAYVDALAVPSELPERWADFRRQQARWAQGSVETARKLLPQIWASPRFTPRQKRAATLHLAGNAGHGLLAVVALALPPALVVRAWLTARLPGGPALYAALDAVGLGVGLGLLVAFYRAAQRRRASERAPRWADVGLALLVGAGLALSSGAAVLRGLRGVRAEFERTPKRGEVAPQAFARRFARRRIDGVVVAELALVATLAALVPLVVASALWGALPFVLAWGAGLAWSATATLREQRSEARAAEAALAGAPLTSGLRGG